MKTLPLVAAALTLVATALPITPGAHAATGIQRCQSASGGVVYTDRSCALLGAKAVPMSGELITRLANERRFEADPDALADIAAPSMLAPVGRRSPASGCAKTPTQLSMDLQGSLALADVNRIAESYHWVGQSHRQAQPLLVRLDRLARQPLQNVEYFDAQIGPGSMQLADASGAAALEGAAGVMQVTFGRGTALEVVDFRVQRYAGCYFVQF